MIESHTHTPNLCHEGRWRLISAILSPAMPNSRKRPPSATPTNLQQTAPAEHRKVVKTNPKAGAKKPGALAALSASITSAIGSPSQSPSDPDIDQPETSRESHWTTAYVAARMAVDIAKESTDMFLPLKAVVGAVSVLIKNYDVKYIQAVPPS